MQWVNIFAVPFVIPPVPILSRPLARLALARLDETRMRGNLGTRSGRLDDDARWNPPQACA